MTEQEQPDPEVAALAQAAEAEEAWRQRFLGEIGGMTKHVLNGQNITGVAVQVQMSRAGEHLFVTVSRLPLCNVHELHVRVFAFIVQRSCMAQVIANEGLTLHVLLDKADSRIIVTP